MAALTITWDDRTDDGTPTGATSEVTAAILNALKAALNDHAGLIDGLDAEIDGLPIGPSVDANNALTTGVDGKVYLSADALGGGSGAVTSVNGQTGAVTITAAGLGAAESAHTHDVADVSDLQTALDAITDLLGPSADADNALSSGTDGRIFLDASLLGGGSGAVSSVNGQTGAVVLDAADVGAAEETHEHAQTDITNLATDLAALQTGKQAVRARLANSPDLGSLDIAAGEHFVDSLSGAITNPFGTAEFGLFDRVERAADRVWDDYRTLGEVNFGRHFFRVYTGASPAWGDVEEYVTTINFGTMLAGIASESEGAETSWGGLWPNITGLVSPPAPGRITYWSDTQADDTTAQDIAAITAGWPVLTKAGGGLVAVPPTQVLATAVAQLWAFTSGLAWPAELVEAAWAPVALDGSSGTAAMDGDDGWARTLDVAGATAVTFANIRPNWPYRIIKKGAGDLTFPGGTNVVGITDTLATAGSIGLVVLNEGSTGTPAYRVFEIYRDA